MHKEKIIIGILAIVLMFSAGNCLAENYQVELNVNDSTIEFLADYKMAVSRGIFYPGVGFIYNEDFHYLSGKFSVEDNILTKGLRGGLGFKGILGSASKGDLSGDYLALGFQVFAEYLIPKRISPIPLEVGGEVVLAPSPISFLDSDGYSEFRFILGIRIIETASIRIGYRDLNINIEKNGSSWEVNDDSLYAGIRIRF